MPLIQVEPNVLLNTDTGLRVIHKPGISVEVWGPSGHLVTTFRAPDSDPAAVWETIQGWAVPAAGIPEHRMAAIEHNAFRVWDRLGEARERLDRLERWAEQEIGRWPPLEDAAADDGHGAHVGEVS